MEDKKNLNNALNKIDLEYYDLFIFDFDGTLVKPLKIDWLGLKKELAQLRGVDFHEDLKISELLKNIKRIGGKKRLKKAYQIVTRYESRAIGKAEIRTEMKDFVNKVFKKGKKIAIFSTNMRETIEKILKKFKLENHFHLIIAKEDVNDPKPDAEGLKLILDKFKISSSRAIFLGNLETDLISGKAARIKTVLI